jgi:DNA-directed RNA polymerase specialized sigma24 family protein
MMPMSGRAAPAPAMSEDRMLAALAAAGDHEAFESIYRLHADRVFALLTRLIGPDREREDLLQDTFVRLHAALPRFRGDASLVTFIYSIGRALAMLDKLRPKHRVAFVLREVMGMSHEEVAEVVGSFAATARMRVNAAKRKLAALAAQEEAAR